MVGPKFPYPKFGARFRSPQVPAPLGNYGYSYGGNWLEHRGGSGVGKTTHSEVATTRDSIGLDEFLNVCTSDHQSTAELSQSLTSRLHSILTEWARAGGVSGETWDKPDSFVEPSVDKARAHLPGLMKRTKQNLVTTITRNDRVEDAVVLVDWRALEALCDLAECGLETMRTFGEPSGETFSPEEAKQLSRVEIHQPLPNRQTAAERRAAVKKFFNEV
jgi:hypothetical protein